MDKVAQVELLDRDGQVRQSIPVAAWPLRVGRALDCDIVLDDPHVAAHHLTLEERDGALALQVGDTLNGIDCAGTHLARGRAAVRPSGEDWTLGRTRLRVRLASAVLAPELPLPRPSRRGLAWLGAALLGLVLWNAWTQYLDSDPGDYLANLVPTLLLVAATLAGWSFIWALGSKLFRHRFDYWTHVRIAASGLLVSSIVGATLAVLAFATSWVLLGRVRGAAEVAVLAVAVHAHLGAVQPQRRRAFGWGVAAVTLSGLLLLAGFQWQSTGRLTEELYHSVLAPPSLRLAPATTPEIFLGEVADLKAVLDHKATLVDDGSVADEEYSE